jgi:hypothetical protein
MYSKLLKKISIYCAALVLVATTGTLAKAADLNDHELYRIVTYTFNADSISSPTVTTKDSSHFNPLMISRMKTNVLSSHQGDENPLTYSSSRNSAQGFAVAVDFHATPKLAFQGVIGVTKNGIGTVASPNFDSSWEANLGVVYKLFNHLSYEMHFGFMDTGDLFKSTNAYSDVESIVMISNQLTMSF